MEMLVVVAILAIVSMIGFSTYGWIDRERLESETVALQQRLEAVKQLTTSTRRGWRLCALDAQQQACASEWSQGYYWNVAQGDSRRLKGSHRVFGVSIDWNRGSSITFSPEPWKMHTLLGTFTLCNDAGRNTLTISDSGRVKLTRDVEPDTDCAI